MAQTQFDTAMRRKAEQAFAAMVAEAERKELFTADEQERERKE